MDGVREGRVESSISCNLDQLPVTVFFIPYRYKNIYKIRMYYLLRLDCTYILKDY